MPDREKAIRILEGNYKNFVLRHNGELFTINELIALLKAQEPVEPTIDIRHGKSMWRCGSCATALQPNQIHTKFCFNCGKAVKWE